LFAGTGPVTGLVDDIVSLELWLNVRKL